MKRLRAHGTDPVDLSITDGECVSLAGPSGAGKTVLLRAIADLDPHEGDVLLDGRPASTFAAGAWRRAVGMLPAESQWWADRVGEHFSSIDDPLWRRLGFAAETAQWEVARLSTGERQRLALLRLLANRPRVLLLDEPTASLDPENAARAEAVIDAYRKEQGAALLWVSHDPAQARRVADRHYRIDHGHLEEATP